MPATTSTLAFFSSAASSFQPSPYTPAPQSSSSRPPIHTTRTHRSHDSLAVPPAGMDPQPTDPNVLFIHPPFNTFPNSHLHPDGLTYSLMAENPEWFLDAHDFLSQPNVNAKAVPYPPHLEPPRGWCPAKKKDLKDRGSEGWPEGEEPRLRCTFCRRTYAGVNAKSMWRRHVFEKHKIAMSNRRDGNPDRPRGRGSGKENRHHAPTRVRVETHDSLVSMVVAPQTSLENISHKSRFRSGKPTERQRDLGRKKDTDEESFLPNREPTANIFEHSDEDSESEHAVRANSPPLTPHAEISSDPPYALGRNSDELIGTSPTIPRPMIPESPYNPLQTPSFRHSPPPLPSDQPWRYPSPSHPLHSNTRDLSLTIVALPLTSPIAKGVQSLEASPMTMLATHSSPLSNSTPIRSSFNNFETPARSKILFSKPMNRPYFRKGHIYSPLSSVKQYRNTQPLEASPLGKPSATPRRHNRQPSELSEAWFSEDPLPSSSSTPLTSSNNDPFSIYDSWVDNNRISPVYLPKAPQEPESPVLRSGSLPTVGLGLGLLEPFRFPADDPLNAGADIDLKEMLSFPKHREIHTEGKRPAVLAETYRSPTEISPPSKKRRMSPETTDS
ncbi:hypothetical protein BDZ97DRAFT_1935883 [Flammula alnicola]|nr:hypothetical protein BDZ97DRAFT_1935883 [Flammula alnicola]